jgi:MinD superfamily P-loop ATPase
MSVGTARNGLVLQVDEARCLLCDDCLARRQCRGKAIRIIDRGEAPFLDLSRCWGCMVCVMVCPGRAIVRQESTP